MKNTENKPTRITLFINDENVISILDQLPKGVKGMFIEQAILEYSSKKPRIEFFFQGITKARRNRIKQQEKVSENSLQIKTQKENNTQTNINSDKIQKRGGAMMFNFGSKE